MGLAARCRPLVRFQLTASLVIGRRSFCHGCHTGRASVPVSACSRARTSGCAVPADAGTMLPPAHMHVALRHRPRLPLPLMHGRCGAAPDTWGDRAAACPRSGLLARHAPLLEQSLAVRDRRGALSPSSGYPRRGLDLVYDGSTRLALCCDAAALPISTAPCRDAGRGCGLPAMRLATMSLLARVAGWPVERASVRVARPNAKTGLGQRSSG